MSASVILVVALAAVLIAYFTYGTFVARRLQISNERPTPAHTMTDGVDYVPAKAPVLLGHHFASIAGASPIIGPITAVVFGWVPALLWIIFGGIFIGAVHDITAMIASVRHKGQTISEVIEEYVGHTGKILFGLFALATLILVIAVFTAVVARGFAAPVEPPPSGFAIGPAAASSSVMFLVLAVIFGVLIYKVKVPLIPATMAGVILLFAAVWAGTQFPIHLDYFSWVVIVLVYCVLAAVTPV